MNIVDRLEYSNIQEYRIGDTECENLVLKALQCGIGNIVIGSSALDLVSDMLEKENNDDIKINIAVSYPSGAYLTEAKVQEIEDLLEIGKKIDGFYAVMQVGPATTLPSSASICPRTCCSATRTSRLSWMRAL